MATHSGISRLATILTLSAVALGAVSGCGANEPNAVVRVGSRNLRCPASDLETALNRESSQVREFYVGCDFIYTRVLCDKPNATQRTAQCHPVERPNRPKEMDFDRNASTSVRERRMPSSPLRATGTTTNDTPGCGC